MDISINPTYLCNFRCPWCYLSPIELSDNTKIPIEKLDELLVDIKSKHKISYIDLYGGEITTLPKKYLNNLFTVINQHYNDNINVITNFSKPDFLLDRDDITISVSYDWKFREKHDLILNNIINCSKPIHILLLANKYVISADNVDELNSIFSNISNIVSVEIKPYSTNQANQQHVSFKDYEDYIIKWLNLPDKDFEFVNENLINRCLSKTYNSFSDDHIYITPEGKYGVLEFDFHDNEYFLELNNLDEYEEWAKEEKRKVYGNHYCNTCEYLGHCMTEHHREVRNLTNSCNGFKGLLNYYKIQDDRVNLGG